MEPINPTPPYSADDLQAAVGTALLMRDAPTNQAITLAIEVERLRARLAAAEAENARLRAELDDLGWSESCRDTGTAPTPAS